MSNRVLEPEIVDDVPAVANQESRRGLSTGGAVALGIGALILLMLGMAVSSFADEMSGGPARRAELEKRRREQEETARAHERASRLRDRFEALCDKYERRPHLEQPGFIERFARVHRRELLRQRRQIIEAYSRLRRDQALVELLKREAPEIYRRATWRMEALARAEKLDVGFVEAHRPRERESAERFRERMTRREVIAADDKIAHAETQLESLLKMQKMLDRYSLDPEDRERIEAELREQILRRNDQDSGKILGPS